MATRDDPLAWLRESGAQGDVIDGLRGIVDATAPGESRWRRLWTECPRGDWLLGIASRLGVDHRMLVTAAIACAKTALEPSDPDTRAARELLDVAQRWTQGDASTDDVGAATKVLEEASTRAPSPAVDAALRAALAVGMGIEDRDVLAGAPACAAESMMMVTLDCGMPLVMSYAHGKGAEAVRRAIPWTSIEERVR